MLPYRLWPRNDSYCQFQKGIFYKVEAKYHGQLIVKNDMGENVSIPMRIVDDHFDYKTPRGV